MRAKLISFTLRAFDKTYTPDPDLPFLYFLSLLWHRALWLLRGWLRLCQPVFIASGVKLICRHRLMIGRYSTLERGVTINALTKEGVIIGENVRIGAMTKIMGTAHPSKIGKFFRLGHHSACGEFCYFGAAGGISIGDRVLMGQYVSFHAQNHIFRDPVTPISEQGTVEQGIKVGDDCWIGAKATILDGTNIGNHCVIAAGAVVQGEFPDHSLIAGAPARQVRNLQEVTHG